MSKRFRLAAIVVLLLIAVGYGGWYLGSKVAYDVGYEKGRNAGYTQAKSDLPPMDLTMFVTTQEYEDLRSDYNTLVEKYNALGTAQSYQTRQPVHCTTNSIGSSMYTNCY